MGIEGKPKKKKVDYEALTSAFMQIPRMDLETARDLLDLGLRERYELQGRSAESLYEEILKKKPKTPRNRLYRLRLAVYCVETEELDPAKLELVFWRD